MSKYQVSFNSKTPPILLVPYCIIYSSNSLSAKAYLKNFVLGVILSYSQVEWFSHFPLYHVTFPHLLTSIITTNTFVLSLSLRFPCQL